nr:hypothetical protein [Staphylococcus haemolyticus]
MCSSDLFVHQVEQRDEQTYGVVIISLDQSPEDVLSKADFKIGRASCRERV